MKRLKIFWSTCSYGDAMSIHKLITRLTMTYIVVMLCMHFTVPVKAEHTVIVDGIKYQIENGTYKVKSYVGNAESINVLSEIGGIEVDTISDYAFQGSNVKTVILPDTIKIIGEGAFWKCELLQKINIPKGTISIGAYCFADCVNLKEIYIPDSVLDIGKYAFYNCSKDFIVFGNVNTYVEYYVAIENIDFNVHKPGKIKDFTITTKSSGNTLKWKEQQADFYQVYKREGTDGKYKKLALIKEATFVDNDVEPGIRYYYKVRSIASKNGTTRYGNFAKENIVTKGDRLKIKLKSKGERLTIKWNNAGKCAKNFQLYMSVDGSEFKLIKVSGKSQFVPQVNRFGTSTANMRTGSEYRFKIKTFTKYKNKIVYSKYSNTVKYVK